MTGPAAAFWALCALAAPAAAASGEPWQVAAQVSRSFVQPDPGLLEINGALNAVEDGRGGLFVVWTDSPTGSFQVYGEHLDGEGRRRWGRSGVPLAVTGGPEAGRAEVSIVPDGGGGAIVAWLERGSLHARRFDPNGAAVWPAPPSAGFETSVLGYVPVSSGDGGAVFLVFRREGADRIGAVSCRLDGEGKRVGGRKTVLTLRSSESGRRWLGFPAAIADRVAGGAWFFLPSVRAADGDGAYRHLAVRLRPDGTAAPATVFESAAGEGQFAVAAPAGPGDALVAWTAAASGAIRLRAARWRGAGDPPSAPAAALLAGSPRILEPRILADAGGAWVSWISFGASGAAGTLRLIRLGPEGGIAKGFAPDGVSLGPTQGVNTLIGEAGSVGAFSWPREGTRSAGGIRLQRLAAGTGPALLAGAGGREVPVPVESSSRCYGTRFVQAFPGPDRSALLLCGIRDGLYVVRVAADPPAVR